MKIDSRNSYESDGELAEVKRRRKRVRAANKGKISHLYERMAKLQRMWSAPGIQEQQNRREILRFPCREQIGTVYDKERGWVSKHRNEECPLCWPHGHSKYDDPGCNCLIGTKPERCTKDEWHRAEQTYMNQKNKILAEESNEVRSLARIEQELQYKVPNPIKESQFYMKYEEVVMNQSPQERARKHREDRRQYREQIRTADRQR